MPLGCLSASATRKLHVIESPNLHCNDTIVVYCPDTVKPGGRV